MNCALWLNKKKVFSAKDISENFDLAALRGYFLAGSLVPWLRANGGADLADRLAAIPENAPDLNDRISEIFGKTEKPASRFAKCAPLFPAPVFCGSGSYSGSFGGSFRPVTFYFGSGGALGSFTLRNAFGSFSLGSYSLGSYNTGSGGHFHEWEWEWFFRRGSFRLGSFSMTSYKGFGGSGAFFFGGSFRPGSFSTELLSPELFGSFSGSACCMLSSDEYDRIMYATLRKCPLDRFGYGIHNI